MQRIKIAVALVIGSALQAPTVQAQVVAKPSAIDDYIEKVVALRTEAAALGFDPNKLFEKGRGEREIVTVAYMGDDFGWPVFSLAVIKGCFGWKAGQGCGWKGAVRTVRAPAPPDLRRPRERGSNLMKHVLRSSGSMRDKLDQAGLEWLEADLDKCPGAAAQFEKAGDLSGYLPNP